MPRKPPSHYLALVAVLLVALAAAGNWYLQPEKALLWLVPMLTMPVLWGAASLLLRRQSRRFATDTARRKAVSQIRNGVTFACAILLVSLIPIMAEGWGLVVDPALSRRISQVVAGLVLVWLGNRIPKMLTPLSALQCDGSRTQAFQRLSGWAFVLAGTAYVIAWIALPVDLATPVSMAAVGVATLILAARLVQLKWFTPKTSPPTEL